MTTPTDSAAARPTAATQPSPPLPTPTLPKGGGAIRGIGEKFAANPVTGTGSMTVPIATSPGRSGFGPQLSLSYDSGSGNGPFGFGWSLSLPAITRKTDKGLPQYRDAEESDVFILSAAEDLVPVYRQDPDGSWVATHPGYQRDADGDWVRDKTRQLVVHEDDRNGYRVRRYRPRIEGLFARIERWTNLATGETHWRSITRDNVTTWYGRGGNSRVFDPEDPSPKAPTRVFSWHICSSYDDKGNAILYEYAAENGDGVVLSQPNERNRARSANRYLKRIRYGNRTPNRDQGTWEALDPAQLPTGDWLFEVVFDYGEAHYEDVPLDPGPAEDQHRYVLASALPDLKWDATDRGWTVRPDPVSSHRAGFEVRTYRRCHRVLMFHHIPKLPTGEEGYEGLVRSTEFDYADLDYRDPAHPVTIQQELEHQGSTRFASFIRRVTQSGYVCTAPNAADRNGVKYSKYLKKSLPPLEFEYSKAAIQDELLEVDAASVENMPAGLDGGLYQWVDLHGEGISGILTEQGGAWFYKRNLSPLPVRDNGIETVKARFQALELVAAKPNLSIVGGQAQFMDLAGDGQPDVVVLDSPLPGLYEHDDGEGWQPFRPFTSRLNRDTRDPNLRFIDLDGDGHADVLVTEDDAFVWHPSLAEEGFGAAQRVARALDEEKGPRLVFADGTQSIYLADMCGDGLTDLVRIRNGDVCYWPNLGHGRFDAKVTMDNAPWFDHPDQFDQRRLRLADIDGSGTNDIIYLHRDGVRLYFNQSGNRLSDPRPLTSFPAVDNVTSVMTADLLGNGAACLVWSSPLPGDAQRPLRYVNLVGDQKPHLLIRSANNLGAETRVQYAPSTKFYLMDKQAGKPWVTRLPFPVQVVERVQTWDWISRNRFVTRYAYHHGYFDGVEREFRGFGMVEQRDTEQIAALSVSDSFPVGENVDAASHVPPVVTKTWFHTGLYHEVEEVSQHFAVEYYGAPTKSDPNYDATFGAFYRTLLPDTVIPSGLSLEEEREGCRALKGSMLRQEVYAEDAGPDSPPDQMARARRPYTVTEQNFTIRALQPRGANRHGVYFTHARESISYHHEREPTDPRVGHALTLEVDESGNVLKSAAVGYGRRQPDQDLTPTDQTKQAQVLITYTESRVSEVVDSGDDHRTPLPCESRTHELTGLTLPAGPSRFTFDEILNAGTAAIALDYEKDSTAGRIEKRLIEHVRTYYRLNDLSGALPLGKLQSSALPFESYKLAFTPSLVAEVFGGRVTDAMLDGPGATPGGGYVHTEGDANWWIPSGKIFHSPTPVDSPAQELAYARQHFFLPHRYRDPFHTSAVSTESFVTYDTCDLLVQETRDALGNRVTVGERNVDPTQPLVRRARDYRVLQPALVMDPNRNRSAVAFDALGMVVGTAVMGKPTPAPAEGDSLIGFSADLTQTEIDQLLADPRGPLAATLLAEATTRVVYDLTAYRREADPAKKPPSVAATLARETHVSDLAGQPTRIQVSLSYSDGFGREIQKKIQAESGPGPQRDASGKIIVDADNQPLPTPNDVNLRWVGSGWTVFNNKGKPVRQYQPFFTDIHRFEFEPKIGVSPVLFYDPVERVVATLHPNHTWEKVVFDPWRQETWDVNDTVVKVDPATGAVTEFDPKTDADVGDFFKRLPPADYLPTWDSLRTQAAHAVAFARQYPDSTDRSNESGAAMKTRVHAATPTVAHADSLGRTFFTVAHNKARYGDPAHAPVEEFHLTRIVLDIEGSQREVIDAKDRVVMRYDYDMLGNRVHQASMEAGERWMLNDVAGKPLYAWDSRDHHFRTAYDPLRRPTDSFLSEGGGAEMRVGRTVYGETHPGYPDPEAKNLRGKVVELRDQAGQVFSDDYDFKGNLRESRRRLAQDYKNTLDWPWPATVPLEPETYASRTRYDALNRPIQLIAPHAARAKVNVIQPAYNDANLLERIDVWLDWKDPAPPPPLAEPDRLVDPTIQAPSPVGVTGIDYDARGQRLLIEYRNNATTRYTYDPLTYRLTHLLTRRSAADFPGDCPQPAPAGWPGCQVQNLHYTYDPAGNITFIRDDAQQTIYFKNTRVEPSAEYTYDAIYRLIEATGREHLGQAGGSPIWHSHSDAGRVGIQSPPLAGRFHPHDGNAMGRYCECYEYDVVGNIMEMIHRVACPGAEAWRRSYAYDEDSQLGLAAQSNRLTRTTIGGTTEIYSTDGDGYDAHGNMLRMPHLQVMQWDFKDQLEMTQRQKVNQQDGERTWYVYDSAGQRVRKVTELAAGQVKDERIYLAGFEIYRKNGANPLVRETLHIMDDKQRIALVETRTQGNEPGVPAQLVRYQFGNHLGSASLELDDQAQIVSYEEYTPYGSTSYQAVRSQTETPKRYRYTGKERDEESGLSYYGVRYYSPWLGRWTACDQLSHQNRYLFVDAKPTVAFDVAGLESNRQLMGLDDASVNASLSRDPSLSNVLKLTAKQTAYDVLNILTANFASKHDQLFEARERGEISESDYWLRTTGEAFQSLLITAATGGVGGKAATGAKTLAGQLVRSGGAGVVEGVGLEALNQSIDILQGERQSIDEREILVAGATGGVFGVGGTVAAQIGVKQLMRMKVKPTDFGLEYIADNPQYLDAWESALQKKLSSKSNNRVKEYVRAMEEGRGVSPEIAESVYNDLRQGFKAELGEELAAEIGEIHHWNYPKKTTYQGDIIDPEKLVVTESRQQHAQLHEATSGAFLPKNSMRAPVHSTQER
jgi:RHS repeat-associated protein